jgi:hypothetical protein
VFKKIASVALSAVMLFAGVSSAKAAEPVPAYANYYESLSLNAPAAGAMARIVGTDLDQVTGAKFVGFSPVFDSVSAAISEQTATSLNVAVPTVASQGTSQLYLTTANGDVLVGYFQHVGTAKISSSIGFRNQVSMPLTARVGETPRDLSELVMVNVTNMAVGTMPVTYTTNNPAICAIVANTLTFSGPGTCTLSAQLLESNGIAASAVITKDIVVGKALTPQTIKASPANTMLTIKGGKFKLTATATSGLPVSFKSSTNSVCFIAFDTVYAMNLGTCTITVTQAGNATFAPAAPYVYNLTITAKGIPGIKSAPNFPRIETKVKAKRLFAINMHPTKGTSTAGANDDGLITKVTVASASKSVCSVTPYKTKSKKIAAYFVKGLKAGKCTLTVAITGNTTYLSAKKNFLVTVSK